MAKHIQTQTEWESTMKNRCTVTSPMSLAGRIILVLVVKIPSAPFNLMKCSPARSLPMPSAKSIWIKAFLPALCARSICASTVIMLEYSKKITSTLDSSAALKSSSVLTAAATAF